MRPLGLILCILFVRKTACGLEKTYSDLDKTELDSLRDLWFNSISKRVNESLSKRTDEFKQLIDVLSKLHPTETRHRTSIFRDMKNVMLKNAREKTFGIFTNFCGPGNLEGQAAVCGIFNGVDECCKAHDTCESYIGEFEKNKWGRMINGEILLASFTSFLEYQKLYPKLPKKRIYFSSLACDCDVSFYNCIKQTGTSFGEVILSIYSVAQSSCFKYEHASKCSKYDE